MNSIDREKNQLKVDMKWNLYRYTEKIILAQSFWINLSFILILYSWPFVDEVTWPSIWEVENTVHNQNKTINSRESETNAELSKCVYLPVLLVWVVPPLYLPLFGWGGPDRTALSLPPLHSSPLPCSYLCLVDVALVEPLFPSTPCTFALLTWPR